MSQAESQQISLLFEQHGARVYRRALRLLGNPADAEEATQEIFIIRDRSRRAALHEEHVAPMLDDSSRADPARPEDMVLIRGLLALADERQAAAAVYVFVDGMSHDEAASVLGVSKRTVGSLLERFQAWASEQVAEGAAAEPPPVRKASGFLGFGRRRS